jgi:thioredoxin reductase (NADPH)
LTKYATKVTLIHRRDSLRASKIMQDRVARNPKVDYAWSSVVSEIVGEKQNGHHVLSGVKLRSTKDDSTRDLKIDGLFLAIGHVPNTAIFKGKLAMTPDGYLLTRTALAWKGVPAPSGASTDWDRRLMDSLPNYGTATDVDGIFACGDVVDTHYRQAITAAGSGCAAAMDCEKWLESPGSGSSRH